MLTDRERPVIRDHDFPRSVLRRLWRARTGATAIEYALIAGILATFIVAGMQSLGGGLGAAFDAIIAKLAAALP
jgi:pilus assembly protein Flp/PilA